MQTQTSKDRMIVKKKPDIGANYFPWTNSALQNLSRSYLSKGDGSELFREAHFIGEFVEIGGWICAHRQHEDQRRGG